MNETTTSARRHVTTHSPEDIARFVMRRRLLKGCALGAAMWLTPGVFAQALEDTLPLTPWQTEGPFYPDKMPRDTDNDLLIISDSITPAVGQVTHLAGRVLTRKGSPVRGALVEIWQVDHGGAYIHSGSGNRRKRDDNFQGYGRFLTSSSGAYYFRTILPVSYPGRTPHIHLAVSVKNKRVLTSQFYIKGEARNARDGIYRSLGKDRQPLVTIDFKPIEESKADELSGVKDIVIGRTPEDRDDDRDRGQRP